MGGGLCPWCHIHCALPILFSTTTLLPFNYLGPGDCELTDELLRSVFELNELTELAELSELGVFELNELTELTELAELSDRVIELTELTELTELAELRNELTELSEDPTVELLEDS